jgi:transcriptional regulator with XRE-family HTH domain
VDPIKDALTRSDGIAARLLRLREQAGLAAKDLATATGFFASKVSRIENGRQTPSGDDIRAWVRACGADESVADELIEILSSAQVERRIWRLSMRRGQVPVQEDYNKLAREAQLIRHFEVTAVPGLIQTPDYARAMIAAMYELHKLPVDDVREAVTKRLQRQQLLYEPGRQFEFLLTEPVLRWILCPPDVMHGQLDRLQTVIGMTNVRFGIIPMGVRLSSIPQNSVVLYVGDEVVASVDTFAGASLYRGDDADAYGAALDWLWPDAVTGEDARRLIVRAMRELRHTSG